MDARLPLLSLDHAKAAASEAGVPAQLAELSIFRLMLRRPRTAKALSDLLISMLFGGAMDDRHRELLIMRIGWTTRSDYEWTQHWPIALQRGCSEAELLAVRDWRAADGFGAPECAVLAATDECLETGTLSDSTFAACRAHLGEDATLELVTAVGTWRLVSKLTRSLAVPLEEGVASWPPDGRPPS